MENQFEHQENLGGELVLSPEEQRFIELKKAAHQKYGEVLPPEVQRQFDEIENDIFTLQVGDKINQDEELRSADEKSFPVQVDEEGGGQAASEEPSVSVTLTEEGRDGGKSPGIIGTVKDMLIQAVGGVRNAAVNTIIAIPSTIAELGSMNLGTGISEFSEFMAQKGETKEQTRQRRQAEKQQLIEDQKNIAKALDEFFPNVPEAETGAGAVVNKLSQIVASIVGPSKFFKATGIVQRSPVIIRSMMVNGVGEYFAFDKHEEGISNIIVDQLGDNPSLVRNFFDLMAVKDDDSEVVARFKRTMESASISIGVENVVLPLFRHLRKLPTLVKQGNEAVSEDLQKTIKEIAEKSNLEVIDDIFDADPSDGLLRAGVTKQVVDPTEVTLEETGRFAEELQKLVSGEEDFLQVDLSDLINVDTFTDPEQMQIILEAYIKATKQTIELNKVVKNVQTVEEAEKKFTQVVSDLSDITGGDAGTILRRLETDAENIHEAMINGVVAKNVIVAVNKKIISLVDDIIKGDELAIEEGSKFLSILDQLTAQYKKVGTESGRLLQSRQIKDSFVSDVGEMLVNRSTEDILELANYLKKAKNDHQVAVMLNGFINGVQNYWINGLLSSPFTHLVNFTSNTANTLRKPFDLISGGIFMGDLESVKEGFTIYMGLSRFMKDSLMAAAESSMRGPILRGSPSTVDSKDFVPGTLNFSPTYKGQDIFSIIAEGDDAKTAAAIHSIGSKYLHNIVNLPSTALSIADEISLQLNYRSALYAKTVRDAIDQGLKPGTDEFAVFVEDALQSGFDHIGKAVQDTSTQREAFRYATDANFSTDLEYDGLIRGIAKFVQQATNSEYQPLMVVSRFVVPFVRTPANLLQDVVDSTPIASRLLSKRFRDDVAAGGARQAEAIGKLFSGSLIWSGMIYLASNGNITGSGPTDPDVRKQLEKAGWRPHSFTWEDQEGTRHYLDLSRFEPYATFLISAGDYMEGIDALALGNEDEFHKKMLSNIVNNISSKKYLTGAINLVNALQRMSQGETDDRFMADFLASFVPSGVKDIRQAVDPYEREARTLIEKIKNRIPGFSNDLPLRYDLRGNPQLGPSFEIYSNNKNQDIVDKEIERLSQFGTEITTSPETYQGVDLREFRDENGKTAYDRLNQLIGSGQVADEEGRTLTDVLKELISSDEYQELSDPSFKEGTIPGGPGGKVALIRDVAQKYRKAALNHIFQFERFYDKSGNDLFIAIQEARIKGKIKTREDAEQLQEILDQLE